MIWRISGGIWIISGGVWILLMGISEVGIYTVPSVVLGIIGIVAGISLLAGI